MLQGVSAFLVGIQLETVRDLGFSLNYCPFSVSYYTIYIYIYTYIHTYIYIGMYTGYPKGSLILRIEMVPINV